MKFYQLTFMDYEHGKILRWRSSKKQIATLVARWRKEYPLRGLVLTQAVELERDKQSIIDYLNENCGGE